jgi:hypothetical protein
MKSVCKDCGGRGVIDTGNNELPCSCPAGEAAQFNVAGVQGLVSGKEVKRHFLNSSPEPISPQKDTIDAATLPGRSRL